MSPVCRIWFFVCLFLHTSYLLLSLWVVWWLSKEWIGNGIAVSQFMCICLMNQDVWVFEWMRVKKCEFCVHIVSIIVCCLWVYERRIKMYGYVNESKKCEFCVHIVSITVCYIIVQRVVCENTNPTWVCKRSVLLFSAVWVWRPLFFAFSLFLYSYWCCL